GLDRELRDPARSWVNLFNHATGPKLSVDIPSGLHGDTGEILGTACRADTTVTFVAKKKGMLTENGEAHCGRIHVVQLGLP
ncbi:MAG: NAD(P)H-hydrate repair Nnr-like enzyme with NAD(P)H-hydrate epimerase domain, partial [Hyphomicrobiaceae bacterium]